MHSSFAAEHKLQITDLEVSGQKTNLPFFTMISLLRNYSLLRFHQSHMAVHYVHHLHYHHLHRSSLTRSVFYSELKTWLFIDLLLSTGLMLRTLGPFNVFFYSAQLRLDLFAWCVKLS